MLKKSQVIEYWRELVLLLLLATCFFTYLHLWQGRLGELHVYFLDIGQGDAILIDTPSHKQLLLDGGPNRRVLSLLGQILPFGDRFIDILVESHPDKDHIGGLPEVVAQYGVGVFIEPGVASSNSIDDLLHERLAQKNVQTVLARRGMVVDFGDGVKLTILFPNQDVSRFETNGASIVARLDYGESSFLLTGDSPVKIENLLLKLNPSSLKAQVLKVGHHGSRTSTSLAYAQAVAPTYAIVSAGEGNQYGHPHQEVLDTLQKVGAQILATENVASLTGLGTIEFITNGETLRFKSR